MRNWFEINEDWFLYQQQEVWYIVKTGVEIDDVEMETEEVVQEKEKEYVDLYEITPESMLYQEDGKWYIVLNNFDLGQKTNEKPKNNIS